MILSAALLRLNDAETAMTVLRPLLASESPDARALSLMGTAEALSGNTEAAVQYLDKAVASSPEDAAIRSTLGLVRIDEGTTAAGIGDLQQVVEMKPESDGGGDRSEDGG